MWPSILVVIYIIIVLVFLWAWMKFMNHVWPNKPEEDYMIGDDDNDWGDKS